MFCTKCGAQLPDDSKFCFKCGAPTHNAEQKDLIDETAYDPFDTPPTTYAPQPTLQQQSPQPQNNTSMSATDEGVFGLVGFILAFFFPILGLIFSIIGMSKKKNNGLATAGFILSILFIILSIILIVLLATTSSSSHYTYYNY